MDASERSDSQSFGETMAKSVEKLSNKAASATVSAITTFVLSHQPLYPITMNKKTLVDSAPSHRISKQEAYEGETDDITVKMAATGLKLWNSVKSWGNKLAIGTLSLVDPPTGRPNVLSQAQTDHESLPSQTAQLHISSEKKSSNYRNAAALELNQAAAKAAEAAMELKQAESSAAGGGDTDMVEDDAADIVEALESTSTQGAEDDGGVSSDPAEELESVENKANAGATSIIEIKGAGETDVVEAEAK